MAASDPLAGAIICHGNGAPDAGQTDQTGHRAHDGCCSACSVLQSGAPVDGPQTAAIAVERVAEQVVWFDFAFRLTNARASSHAQARAPPSFPDDLNTRTIGAAPAVPVGAVNHAGQRAGVRNVLCTPIVPWVARACLCLAVRYPSRRRSPRARRRCRQ
ncbi:DUF2946 family protein [Bradyrhizobium sp. RDT10]